MSRKRQQIVNSERKRRTFSAASPRKEIGRVVGRDGNIETLNLMPPFDKTPTGYCIRTALKGITFPRFKGEKMIITYPFQVE